MGYEVDVHFARQSSSASGPVILATRPTRPKKMHARTAAKAAGRMMRRLPLFSRSRSLSRRQRKLQRILRRTGCNTCHARGALHRSDLHQPVYRKMRRANPSALFRNRCRLQHRGESLSHWAEQRRQPQQCSIRTEIPTPKVLDEHGQRKTKSAMTIAAVTLSHIAEEIEHFDISNQASKAWT